MTGHQASYHEKLDIMKERKDKLETTKMAVPVSHHYSVMITFKAKRHLLHFYLLNLIFVSLSVNSNWNHTGKEILVNIGLA